MTRTVTARTRELIDEGNARRLVLQREQREIVSVPLTVAALIGGVAIIFTPVLAVFATIAALLAKVRARIEPR